MGSDDQKRNPDAKPEHPGPDFVIVGPLRAGTTMLRLMLNNHPGIALVGEFEESVAMLDGSGWPSPEQFRLWLAQHRTAVSREYNLDDSISSYPDIVGSMWSQLAQRQPQGTILGCTIHSRIDRILDLWPDTRIIGLVRDPRDVCRSCVGMGWYGHPADAINDWIRPVARLETLRRTLPEDRTILIRYEDLLQDPEAQLGACCTLLGLGYDRAMLDFHEQSSYQRLDPNLAEQWKRKMSPRCAQIIDARCAQHMRPLGYETSVEDPKDATMPERLKIKLTSRLGRLRWRINRYGIGLVLSWAVAKRLPIQNRWRTKVRKRINEIDRTHLR